MRQLSQFASAQNHYRTLELSSKLESASPHGLVAILYEELLRSLDVMSVTLKKGRVLSQEHHTNRARSILIALSASLDFNQGGSVAVSLSSVYRAMTVQLENVIHSGDASKLTELRQGLTSISAAWNKIVNPVDNTR